MKVNDLPNQKFEVVEWNMICFGRDATLSKISECISELMITGQFGKVSVFILESQPLRNVKALCISHMLSVALRCSYSLCVVQFMRPQEKFLLDSVERYRPVAYEPKTTEPVDGAVAKKRKVSQSALNSREYRRRKKWSINICHAIVIRASNNIDAHRQFELADKKDDLADAALYAAAYIVKTANTLNKND